MEAKIISVSGIDGSGKSSIIKGISSYLKNKNQRVLLLDAMQPCKFTEGLRNVAKNQNGKMFEVFGGNIPNICYCADFHHNIVHNLKPVINDYDFIIFHRYKLCCEAYSMLNECDMDLIKSLLSSLPEPDLQFYLDVNIDIAMERIDARSKKRSSKENKETLSRVIKNYDFLMRTEFNKTIKILNDSSVEESLNLIKLHLDKWVGENEFY